MTPPEQLKSLLEELAGKALDNLDEYGFHLPVCFARAADGERFILLPDIPEAGPADLQACKESVLASIRHMVAEGRINALALATVANVLFESDTGERTSHDVVKIVLDHADEPGYIAYLTYTMENGKTKAGDIHYQPMTERFFSPPPQG